MIAVKSILNPVFILLLILSVPAVAQVKITDGADSTIDANSLLELESTSKGLLVPRMAINNLSLPAPLTAPVPTGMLVYSTGGTVTDGFYYWTGTAWRKFVQATVQVNEGGTGLTALGNANQVLSVNSAGTGYTHRAIKQQIGTWGRVNLTRNQTNLQMLMVPEMGANMSVGGSRVVMAFNGRIVGIVVSGSALCTAGTAIFTVFRNGVASLVTATISTANPQFVYTNNGNDTFVAGDILDIRVTTDGTLAPNNSLDFVSWIIIEWTN